MEKTILIVEDDPKNLTLFRDLLKVTGYITIEATNGRQGVELAKARQPGLILMDIQLPEMDGIEATKILKADIVTRKIPVIALTSYAMKEDREKAFAVGFDGYLPKPIDIHEFLKIVADFLSPEG